jgi:hypothetical protein
MWGNISYTSEFKEKVIKFAEQNVSHAEESYFCIMKQTCYWHKQKKLCAKQSAMLEHSGAPKLENFLNLKTI